MFTIKNPFTSNLSRDPDLVADLEEIALEQGFTSNIELLRYLVETTKAAGNRASRIDFKPDTSKAPKSSETLFVAPIHPRAKEMVEELRNDLFEEKNYEDPQILAYFARLHRQQKNHEVFFVPAAPKLRELILQKGSDPVKSGKVSSYGRFLAAVISRALDKDQPEKSSEKPRKKGIFEW